MLNIFSGDLFALPITPSEMTFIPAQICNIRNALEDNSGATTKADAIAVSITVIETSGCTMNVAINAGLSSLEHLHNGNITNHETLFDTVMTNTTDNMSFGAFYRAIRNASTVYPNAIRFIIPSDAAKKAGITKEPNQFELRDVIEELLHEHNFPITGIGFAVIVPLQNSFIN